jgi:hypothetical protein
MRKKLKTSTNDRKCIFPGCTQTLSIYNHEEYCHVHRDQMADRQILKSAYHHFSEAK